MADVHTKKQRSYNMSRIRSSNTRPEILLKGFLKGSGLRYLPKVCGKPDFGSRKKKVAVFVDGCFWHGCPKCYTEPENNRSFWKDKTAENKKRDRKVNSMLKYGEWRVIRVWEHTVIKEPEAVANKIKRLVTNSVP